MAADSSNGASAHSNGHVSYAEKHSIAPHFIGGNRLENAPASKVKDFVAQNDGHTVITNVSNLAILRDHAQLQPAAARCAPASPLP